MQVVSPKSNFGGCASPSIPPDVPNGLTPVGKLDKSIISLTKTE